MGYGVPAGLGVQAATGNRTLILVGDGAFQMTGWELGNCRRYGWDPIVLLFNNCSWEMLRAFQPESRFNDLDDWTSPPWSARWWRWPAGAHPCRAQGGAGGGSGPPRTLPAHRDHVAPRVHVHNAGTFRRRRCRVTDGMAPRRRTGRRDTAVRNWPSRSRRRCCRATLDLLPAQGVALDLACGLGGNAVLPGRPRPPRPWPGTVRRPPIEILARQSRERALPITAEVRDVVERAPEPGRFDVIVVSRFLERDLAPALMTALRPGGLLFDETFTRTRVSDRGPRRRAFRLADNELLRLFAPLQIVFYREEGRLGDTTRGLRDVAQLVACRPSG
ncbi:MAG: thiamine pyrophosphate-dependent enzyme [Arhodomonas sp.]|nr:thiamine pyrophosphate-dependent enzyme [Arhodomonas sp.]